MNSERIDDPTPSGGTYSIMNYMDVNGDPADKDVAVKGEVSEFDGDGIQIRSTLFDMSPSKG